MVDKSAFAEALSEMEADETCPVDTLKMLRQAISAYESENDELKQKVIAQECVDRLMRLCKTVGGKVSTRSLDAWEAQHMQMIGRLRNIQVDPITMANDLGEVSRTVESAIGTLQNRIREAEAWIRESKSAKLKSAPGEAMEAARVNLQQAIRAAGAVPGAAIADEELARRHGERPVFRAQDRAPRREGVAEAQRRAQQAVGDRVRVAQVHIDPQLNPAIAGAPPRVQEWVRVNMEAEVAAVRPVNPEPGRLGDLLQEALERRRFEAAVRGAGEF